MDNSAAQDSRVLHAGSEREQQIRGYLRRLLASRAFASTERRARLLEYLCDRALGGEGDAVTEYGLGLDVFGKSPSFDPRTESTVRVELSRLRQTLKHYYATEGAGDEIVIAVPARSYVPTFTFASQTAETTAAELVQPHRLGQWISARSVSIAAPVMALLAAFFILPRILHRPPSSPAFSIAVLPTEVSAAARQETAVADGFAEELIASLATVPDLSVADWMSVASYRGPDGFSRARKQLPFAMLLVARIDRTGTRFETSLKLFERSNGRPLWSGVFPLPDPVTGPSHLRSDAQSIVECSLGPLLERDLNIAKYQRSTGNTADKPLFGPMIDADNACTPGMWDRLTRARSATVELIARFFGARSSSAGVLFTLAGKQLNHALLPLPAGRAAAVRAPELIQLATDTCVRGGYLTSVPVYSGGCVVPPAGVSSLVIWYKCAAKAFPLDLAPYLNQAGLWGEGTFPVGYRMIGGVPFLFSAGHRREWAATTTVHGSARPAILSIPVKRNALSTAYFVMNTVWGAPGPASYLSISFTGNRGAHFEKQLVGGVDIRDYNQGLYTNSLNGTTSRPGLDNGRGQRMDLVEIALPRDFRSQTLDSITIKDTGKQDFQRVLLWAVTVR